MTWQRSVAVVFAKRNLPGSPVHGVRSTVPIMDEGTNLGAILLQEIDEAHPEPGKYDPETGIHWSGPIEPPLPRPPGWDPSLGPYTNGEAAEPAPDVAETSDAMIIHTYAYFVDPRDR